MKVKDFFTEEQKEGIKESIMMAELDTSGEIRVHIDDRCKTDSIDRARFWFKKLNMHRTELRNGVLFYLALKDRKFAIIGDEGIDKKVPDDFWDNIKNALLIDFREGNFAEGLCNGVDMAGHQLKKHFPYQKGDINELSDEISFGKESEL